MPQKPKVSVVVNNFKKTDHLYMCLNALLATKYNNVEVIVIDSCTPEFNLWMNQHFQSIKFIHLDNDIGASSQRNVGLKHVSTLSEYVCFMDDDVIVEPDWLDHMISALETFEDVGAAQPILLDFKDKTKVDSIGHLMTHVGYPYKILGSEENLAKLKVKKVMNIFYAETAVIVIRANLLRDLNDLGEPFDSDYHMHWYDVDLSWRIWLMSYRVVIVSDSICFHDRGVSGGLKKLRYSNIFLNTRNRLITMMKNYETVCLLKYLPVAIVLEMVKGLALLFYRPDHSKATFSAIVWVLTHLRYTHVKRKMYRRPLLVTNESIKDVFVKTSIRHLLREFSRHYD